MSTFSELKDECLNYGFSSTRYRTRFGQWLNDAQNEVCRRVFVRELLDTATVSTSSGTATYSLPADFVRVTQLLLNDEKLSVDPVSIEWFATLSAASGTPRMYALDEGGLNLYPTPDGVYALTLRYYRDPADMSADADTPVIPAAHQRLLISYALAYGYRAEDDQERAVSYMADYERELARFANDRRGENQDGPVQLPGMWNTRHPQTPEFRS